MSATGIGQPAECARRARANRSLEGIFSSRLTGFDRKRNETFHQIGQIGGTGKGNDMKTDWIPTSKALPLDGSVVEFVLDHRDMAMSGTYRQRRFASRWSEYEMTAVREWRPASTAACPAPCAEPTRAAASSQ